MVRMMKKRIKFFIGTIILTAVISIAVFPFLVNEYTEYCPFSHKIRDTAKCVVLDRNGSEVLIQHVDLDKAVGYIERKHAGRSLYFQLPLSMCGFAPRLNTPRMIAGDTDRIIFEGSAVKLLPCDPSF